MKSARNGFLMLGAMAAASLAFSASGQVWTENFDSYADGSSIHGQGGWTSWDGDSQFESFVSSDQARSGPHSLKVEGNSDTIFRFDEQPYYPSCGQWRFECWVYVPSGLVETDDTYFILLDLYEHGLGTNNHWASQNHWDQVTDNIIADFDNETLPTVYDTWMRLRCDFDLDNDLQNFYYGNDLLYTDSWTANINSGGQLFLDAVDLFAFGASAVYYDDFSLRQLGDCPPEECITLDLDRLIAGLTSTWTVSGLNQGQAAAIVWGLNAGQSQGTAFGYCYDFAIAGINSTDRLLAQVTGDANGEGSYSRSIPDFQGLEVLFQAAAQGTCPDACMSNVITETIQ